MAITEELLAALSPAARAALPFIEKMVAEGAATSAIQGALEAAGESFRRTDFLRVIRAVKDVQLSRDYLASVPKKFLPNPARLPAPVGKTLRAFSFRVAISGRGDITGTRADQTITVSSTTNMPQQIAIDRAIALFLANQQQYRPDEESIDPSTIQADVTSATYRT